MNIIKKNAIGVDAVIEVVKEQLYTDLAELWELSESNSLFTGRCYKNKSQEGVYPEMYVSANEYSDLLLDDTKKAQMFVVVGDSSTTTNGVNYKVRCGIVFLVNVTNIYPSTRNDEEIRIDVLNLLNEYGYYNSEIVTGLDKVFVEFNGWKIKNGIKYSDMNPFHAFRINVDLDYTIKCTQNF
jgi:hypothetical protein